MTSYILMMVLRIIVHICVKMTLSVKSDTQHCFKGINALEIGQYSAWLELRLDQLVLVTSLSQ